MQVLLATLLQNHRISVPADHPVPQEILGLGMRADAVRMTLTPV